MLPYTLALVVAGALIDTVMSEPLTFLHRDPMSSKMLTCDRCPAGYYMKRPCTPHHQTLCEVCPHNHFTQFSNYLPKCLYCSTFCGEHQVVKQPCTTTSDRVCECKPGYHKRADFCVKHRDCPAGQGVKQKGTALKNTVCESCEPGTFSAEKSSTAACVQHTDCVATGLRVALRGAEWHDNICMSCQAQKANGTLAPLRPILSALLTHGRLRLGKMRKLARLLTGRRPETTQPGTGRSPSSERARLLATMDKWAQEEPEAGLRRLAHALKGEMHHVARELESKITEIDEEMMQCENSINTQDLNQGTHTYDTERKNVC